jgi:hypothetical protein
MAKKPAKTSKEAKAAAKKAPALAKKAPAPKSAKAPAKASPVAVKKTAAKKAAPAPKAKAAPAKKTAAKVPAKAAPAAKKPAESPRGPGRPRKSGSADYAVQARKLKALLDCLALGEALSESQILKTLASQGFEAHPRTLAREVERLSIIGFPVVRISAPEGLLYQLPEDELLAEALAALEDVRKALRKEGSSQEKPLAAAIKLLKE